MDGRRALIAFWILFLASWCGAAAIALWGMCSVLQSFAQPIFGG